MSGNHHDEHHSNEAKPVSFTVPLILASVVLLIIVLFLSVCDPRHGHHPEGEAVHHDEAVMHQQDAATGDHHEAAAEPAAHDSTTAPAIAPEVEGKPAEAAHH